MPKELSSNFPSQYLQDVLLGAVKITPLCLAVLPWGLLTGSMAIQAGLSPLQAVAMSAFIFAGAAQLVSLGLIMASAPVISIIISVLLVTSQHYLYALKLRRHVQKETAAKRLLFGFLLTDELFAISSAQPTYQYRVLLGAGLWFYLCWLLFSCCGVLLTASFSNLEQLHLDFSIVATFIAIIVPLIKNRAAVVGVGMTVIFTGLFLYFDIFMGGLLAAIIGMFSAAWSERWEHA